MRKNKALILLALAPALLCGCTSRCTFKEYQEKINSIDAENIPAVTKVELEYKDGKNKDHTVVDGTITQASMSVNDFKYGFYYSQALSMSAQAYDFGWGTGDPNIKYFIGNSSSKIIETRNDIETTLKFNQYGHCTFFLEKNPKSKVEVKIKYTYAK